MTDGERAACVREYELVLRDGGYEPQPRKHRCTEIGDIYSYRRFDGTPAHLILPPCAWGPPHDRRQVFAVNHEFADDDMTLVAGEDAWMTVFEDARDEVAPLPLSARGCRHLRDLLAAS
jgi:hypothetical protein